MVDIILRIKDLARPVNEVLADLAAFAVAQFGKGGNPDAVKQEDFLGYIQTPVLGGYMRVRIDSEYADALQAIEDAGGNPLAQLVEIRDMSDNTPFMVDVETPEGIVQQELGHF